jgi:ribonuclease HI
LKRVVLYTDGACSGNPGPGGWAAILVYGPHEREVSGGEPQTTNNRMELTAVVEGLRALKERCRVTIYSDSQYVVNAFVKHWIEDWKRRGWKNSKRKAVPNRDLWEALLSEV